MQILAVVFGVKLAVDYRVKTSLREVLEARKPTFTPSAAFFKVSQGTPPSAVRTWAVFYWFRRENSELRCVVGFEGDPYILSSEDLARAGGKKWLDINSVFRS